MTNPLGQASQLVFYPFKNWAGDPATRVSHGDSGIVASSAADWRQQSVAVGTDGIQAFLFSTTDTTLATQSYAGHTDAMVTQSISDLTSTFPGAQFSLQYLGVDVNLASRVVLTMAVPADGPDVLAATWLLPSTQASFSTLTLPQTDGALAFFGTATPAPPPCAA